MTNDDILYNLDGISTQSIEIVEAVKDAKENLFILLINQDPSDFHDNLNNLMWSFDFICKLANKIGYSATCTKQELKTKKKRVRVFEKLDAIFR